MDDFLKHCKKCLAQVSQYKSVHVVMGNEACDLDSTCSAIVYAYYLHQTKSQPDVVYLPLLNILRTEIKFRAEILHHLGQFSLGEDLLTFRDQLDLHALRDADTLRLTLVDHNVLPVQDQPLEAAVVQVIDHHKRERPQDERLSVTIESIGSCCSLVAEKLITDTNFEIDQDVAELLYGVIIFDTINLSEEAGIKTSKDVDISTHLNGLRAKGATSSRQIFMELTRAKADISELTTMELLQKDLKIVSSDNVKVAMCSLPLSVKDFLARDGMETDLSTFTRQKEADLIIFMSLVITEDGSPERQIGVFSENLPLQQQFVEVLTSSSEPPLKLSALSCALKTAVSFHQGNVQASRKKVLPLVKSTLNSISEATTDTGNLLSPDSGTENLLSPDSGTENLLSPDSGKESLLSPDSGTENLLSPDSGTENLLSPDSGKESLLSPDSGTENPLSPDSGTENLLSPDSGKESLLSPDSGTENPLSPDSSTENLLSPDSGTENLLSPDSGKESLLSPESEKDSLVDLSGGQQPNPPTPHEVLDPFSIIDLQGVTTTDSSTEVHAGQEAGANTENLLSPDSGKESLLSPDSGTENLLSPDSGKESLLSPESEKDSLVDVSGGQQPNPPTPHEVLDPFSIIDLQGVTTTDSSTEVHAGQEAGANTENLLSPDSGKESLLSPDSGTENLLSPDSSTETLLSPDRGKESLLSPDSSTENLLSLDSGKESLLSPDRGKESLLSPDSSTENLLSLDSGKESLLFPDSGTENLLLPVRGTENLLSPDSEKDSLVDVSGGQQPNPPTPHEVLDPFSFIDLQGVTTTDSSTEVHAGQETGANVANIDLLGDATLPSSDQPEVSTSSDVFNLLDLGEIGGSATGVTSTDREIPETEKGSPWELSGQLDSIKPGGLLDLNFFDPKSESSSEVGSVESLEDYAQDAPAQEAHMRTEREVLELLTEALEDVNQCADKTGEDKSKQPNIDSVVPDSPPEIPAAHDSEDNLLDINIVKSTQPQAKGAGQPLMAKFAMDPFADHEGVLIQASPVQGTTPDVGVTPDTSQPTSPPNLSYPGTPPNSLMDPGRNVERYPELPSFMNADMVRRIQAKKAAFMVTDETDLTAHSEETSADTFPFTPQNSMADLSHADLFNQKYALPTFDNAETVHAVQNKRSGLAGFEPQLTLDAIKFPYAPPNSFSESSFEFFHSSGGAVELKEDDFAQRIQQKKSKMELADEEPIEEIENEDENEELSTASPDRVNQKKSKKELSDEEPIEEMENEDENEELSTASPDRVNQKKSKMELADEEPIEEMENEDENEELSTASPDRVNQKKSKMELADEEPIEEMENEDENEELSTASPDRVNQKKSKMELADEEPIEEMENEDENEELSTASPDRVNQKKSKMELADEEPIEEMENEHENEELSTASPDRVNQKKSKMELADEEPIEEMENEHENEELSTASTDNVIAYQIAERMKAEVEKGDDSKVIVPEETFQTADNVVARQIAQQMEKSEAELSTEASVWDGKMLRYTGESDMDVAYQLAQDVIQRALDDFEVPLDTITKEFEAEEETIDDTKTRCSAGDALTIGEMIENTADTSMSQTEAYPDMIETEYLGNIDLLRGQPDLVTSPEPRLLKTSSEREVAESASFDMQMDGKPCVTVDNVVSKVTLDEELIEEVEIEDGNKELSTASTDSVNQRKSKKELADEEPIEEIENENKNEELRAASTDNIAAYKTVERMKAETEKGDDSKVMLPEETSAVSRNKDGTAVPFNAEHPLEKEDKERQSDEAACSVAVHFALPGGSAMGKDGPGIVTVGEAEGRPHSDTQISDPSTADSELSQSIQDFLSRMRSDTGVSVMSTDVDELVNAAQNMAVAREIVDDAITAAVEIVKKDGSQSQEKLSQQGEWDEEQLKTRMDQVPEQVGMDTGSTSKALKDGDEEEKKSPQRPQSLETTPKKRIVPNMDLLKDEHDDSMVATASVSSTSDGDILEYIDNLRTPDDLNTPEALTDSVFEGELDWEDKERKRQKGDESEGTPVEPIPEYTAKEEFEDERNWRSVTVGDKHFRIDMKVIEPYKKVLSHGGYYGDGFNAIIVFAGCYLPDKRRRDYHYVMDNLFLYVLSTLELLVVEDYMVVYFHGATPKHKMPSLRWLKRCYEMIDRRLRKNLKSLLIVHPTIWLRTIVLMTKPFISSKFTSKLKYIRGLKELHEAIPTEYVYIPEDIKVYDAARFKTPTPNPANT